MDSLLNPVINRAVRIAKDVTTFVNSYFALIAASDNINTQELENRVEKLHDAFVEFLTAYAYLKRSIENMQHKAKEADINDPSEVITAAQDNVLVLNNLNSVISVDYIEWARHTLVLMPELFEMGIREVLSHPDGPEQVEWLLLAIEKLKVPK